MEKQDEIENSLLCVCLIMRKNSNTTEIFIQHYCKIVGKTDETFETIQECVNNHQEM